MSEAVGMIGLGSMGLPIAQNLLQAGYRLTVYNRTASKAAGLGAKGARIVSRPGEVASRGGIVVTMVSDDLALENLCAGEGSIVACLGAGGMHLSMSTIAPATARRLAGEHANYGVSYIAAPVFGRPEAARTRQLAVCLSGPAAAKKRVEPVVAAISRATFDFGEDVGAANVVKLCGNFMLAAAIETMAEAFTLAEKNGIDRVRVAKMLTEILFPCPVYEGYGQRVAENAYAPAGFRLALGWKDIRLVLEAAASASLPMPLASLLRDRWLGAMAKKRENLDWAAAALGVAEDAGMKVPRAL